MKFKKSIIIATMVSMLLLQGCGSDVVLEPLNMIEETNSIDTWEAELDKNTDNSVVPSKSIRGLVVKKDGEDVFAISYEPRDYKGSFDYWNISVPYNSYLSTNTEILYTLFDALEQLKLVETDSVTLEDAGLTSDDNSIFIAYDESQTNENKGQPTPNKAKKLVIGSEDGQGNYYVTIEDSNKVYTVDKADIDDILNLDPFRFVLKIPTVVGIDTVDTVNVIYGDETNQIKKNGEEWTINGKSSSTDDVNGLYGALLYTKLTDELDKDDNSFKDSEPVITIQFIRNMENASDIELKYYEYDDENMCVVINDKEQFLVDKNSVIEMVSVVEASFK